MALETLKGIKEVDGNGVMTNHERPLDESGNVHWEDFDEMRRSDFPICIDHEKDMISFKMMTKPASEGGSGCQLTTLIETALIMIKYLDEKFPCEENRQTINNLVLAMEWQNMRTKERKSRGVEGYDKA